MHAPTTIHIETAYHVFWYLNKNESKVCVYKKTSSLTVDAYTNVDWVRSLIDKISTLGYYIFVSGNLVTRSKKQSVVIRFTVEADFKLWHMGFVNSYGYK